MKKMNKVFAMIFLALIMVTMVPVSSYAALSPGQVPFDTNNDGVLQAAENTAWINAGSPVNAPANTNQNDIGGIGNVSISNNDLNIDGITNQTGDNNDVWGVIFSKYKSVILGFTGIATITMIAFFIMNFLKLAKSADNPNQRSSALSGLLWTGLATAGLGSITIIVAFFYNSIK